MDGELVAGATLLVLALFLAIGVFYIVTVSVNDLLSNRVWLRVRAIGAREFRARLDAWVSIPILGLFVSMVPSGVSWLKEEYGSLAAQVGFYAALYLIMGLGLLFGVLRYDEVERFRGSASARTLLAGIREVQSSGEGFTSRDIEDIDRSLQGIGARLASPTAAVARLTRLVEKDPYAKMRRAEVDAVARWNYRGSSLTTRAFWRESLEPLRRGWLICAVALIGYGIWLVPFGHLLTDKFLVWTLLVLAFIMLTCVPLRQAADAASLEYEAKVHVLETRALERLRRSRRYLLPEDSA